jgi:hypothetical protein
VEGEVLLWDPKQRVVDPYLAAPHDDRNMVQAKGRNELEGLRRVWLEVRSALAGKAGPAALQAADAFIAQAAGEVERDKLRSEVILESLAAAQGASAEPAVREAAALVASEVVPALRNRPSLLYLNDAVPNMDLETFHHDLKRLERDRVMVKIFDRFLRLLNGFDSNDKDQAFEKRLLAGARRAALASFFPTIAGEIAAGRTAEQALNSVLGEIQANLDLLKAKILAEPKNLTAKKNFTLFEEFAGAFGAVKDDLRGYDYVYEHSDLAEIARSKKEAELERHLRAWALVKARFSNPPAALRAVMGEFEEHMRAEILQGGRPLQYGAAEFFYRHHERLESLNEELSGPDQEGPVDLLMFYSHAARGGAREAASDRDLVIIAQDIRDEADYQDLRMSFREHGRIAGIVTVGRPDRDAAIRIPHWAIFADQDGVVPLPWANAGSRGLSLADLARRLEKPGGAPGSAVLDGRRGEAILNPSPGTRADWLARGGSYHKLQNYYQARALRPASFDGRAVRLLADEANPKAFVPRDGHTSVEASGAAGVGLLRMEKFMEDLGVEWDRGRLAAGLQAILAQPQFRSGAPLVVRLFDLEGDKVPKFLRESRNPGLKDLLETHSNVRFYLDPTKLEYREFGKMQLKAIFDAHRAALPGGNVRILLSNVRDAAEIRAIEDLLKEAADEYVKDLDDPAAAAEELATIPVGYMVEEVGTVRRLKGYMAQIAKLRKSSPRERFLAIGTNDYTRSLLQDDPDAVEKLSKLQPGLAQGIWRVASAAAAQDLELTIDGEWGSSPRLLLVLLALRAYHGVQATPVAYPSRSPELYGLARTLTREDLETSATGRPGEDVKTLLGNLVSGGRRPNAAQFDRALSALVQKLEDRVLHRLAAQPAPKP